MRRTAETWASTVLAEIPSRWRDLLVEVAAGDVAQDLALARGELVELGVGDRRRVGLVPGEGVEHEAGEARREHGVAAGHAATASASSGPEIVFVT